MSDPSDLEALAAAEHQSWAAWTSYMLGKIQEEVVGSQAFAGAKNIDPLICFGNLPCIQRWKRQLATPYDRLSEKEKASDRDVVRLKLPVYRPPAEDRGRTGELMTDEELTRGLALTGAEWEDWIEENGPTLVVEVKERLRSGRWLQRQLAAHHLEQFGPLPLSMRSTKLAEETGEVCGAIVRHVQQRDGRSWLPEIAAEIGDVLIVLLTLCEELGVSLEEITRDASVRFLAREWNQVSGLDPSPEDRFREWWGKTHSGTVVGMALAKKAFLAGAGS